MFLPNFKILGAAVSEKPLTQIFPRHYIGVRDGKKETSKKKAEYI